MDDDRMKDEGPEMEDNQSPSEGDMFGSGLGRARDQKRVQSLRHRTVFGGVIRLRLQRRRTNNSSGLE